MWACGCACVLCMCAECSSTSWPCPLHLSKTEASSFWSSCPPPQELGVSVDNLPGTSASCHSPHAWEEHFQITHSDVLCWGAVAGSFTLPSMLECEPHAGTLRSRSPILSLIGPCLAMLGLPSQQRSKSTQTTSPSTLLSQEDAR